MTRFADIKYHRAISLCNDALYTLCCGQGDIRSRLSIIDKEFFCLKPEEFPDVEGLRSNFELLSRSVRKLLPKGDEGSIQATISRSHLNTLQILAQRIWDIHHAWNTYVKLDDKDLAKVLHGDTAFSTDQGGQLPFIDNVN